MRAWWRDLWPDEQMAALGWAVAAVWVSAAIWPLTLLLALGCVVAYALRRVIA